MTRLTSFAKYFGIGVTVGSIVAARHCYGMLGETSAELATLLARIERTGREVKHNAVVVASQIHR